MADLHTIEPENPAKDVVAVLEAALEQAKRGEISSVGLALVLVNGRGAQKWSTVPNLSLMVGSAARLLHHMNRLGDES